MNMNVTEENYMKIATKKFKGLRKAFLNVYKYMSMCNEIVYKTFCLQVATGKYDGMTVYEAVAAYKAWDDKTANLLENKEFA